MLREGAFYALEISVSQRFRQTMRLPHSSMESSTVARSQGLKGLTTHTGGAAGTLCGGQGGGHGGGQAGPQPQGRGGSHGLGGRQPQGF